MRRSLTLLLLAVLSVLGSASSVIADGAARTVDPVAPAPEECTIGPRPREFFAPFVDRDPVTPVLPAQIDHPTPVPPPAGHPADPVTIAEVETAIRMSVACLNALDFPRLFALFSDSYLERALTANPPTAEVLDLMFAPSAPFPPDLHEAIVAIRDVTLLADGRVAAISIADEAQAEPGYEYHLLILVREDGRLRIDVDHKTYLPADSPIVGASAG